MTEYKLSAGYTKAVNDRTVTGLAAVMGNVDDGYDRLHPGAFTNTLKARKDRIKHLWQHDFSQPPIAVVRDVYEVGKADLPEIVRRKAPEATGGLMVVREYLDTPRGNEILAGIKAGALREMSFAYDVRRADFTTSGGKQIRELREVELLETSDVILGMNSATLSSAKNWHPHATPLSNTEAIRLKLAIAEAEAYLYTPAALAAKRVEIQSDAIRARLNWALAESRRYLKG